MLNTVLGPLLLIGLLGPAFAADVGGYRAARWGMSPAQVQAVIDARLRSCLSPARADITILCFDETIFEYSADGPSYYEFMDGELRRVVLKFQKGGWGLFYTLRPALIEKYGAPGKNRYYQAPSVSEREANWGALGVSLIVDVDLEGNARSVTLSYEQVGYVEELRRRDAVDAAARDEKRKQKAMEKL